MGEEDDQVKANNGVVKNDSKLFSLFASKNLLSPQGQQVKISDLQGKIVGIYFSANWYPPCQKFTPLLANAYMQLKNSNPGFEIVYVSSDEDLSAFNRYHSSMPWPAVPFSDLETRRGLTRRFDIEGIPCLIILQPNSAEEDSTTRQDGVDLIYRYGTEAYPFTNEKLEELLRKERDEHENQSLVKLLSNCERDFLIGQAMQEVVSCTFIIIGCTLNICIILLSITKFKAHIICHIHNCISMSFTRARFPVRGIFFCWESCYGVCDRAGIPDRDMKPKPVPISSLEGRTVGLLFSAQWCSPGVKFTAKLASIYQKINDHGHFEILFISSDHDQTSFNSYFLTMPWLALPFNDPNAKMLTKYFDVREIPSLIIVGPDGKTVTKEGRSLVNLYQESAYPFTQGRIDFLLKEIDEASQQLPKTEFHKGHNHELTLVSEGSGGGSFICCDCDEQGSGWGYLCLGCGYEVHPKCVRGS